MRSSVLTIIVVIFMVTACVPAHIVFPKAEIIYQAIDAWDKGKPTNRLVGFINADGTNDETIELTKRPSRPVFSNELGGVIFLSADNPVDIFGLAGNVAFVSESGKYRVCDTLGGGYDYSFPIPETRTLLVNSVYKLEIVNLDNCEVVKTLVEPGINNDFRLITSAHISLSAKKVVFTADWGRRGMVNMARILVLDVQTGDIQEMPFTGGNPTLSPDGNELAYMGTDGIYMANIAEQESKLLVPITGKSFHVGEDLPYPFWSPDGKWLVYHKCINNKGCDYLKDFSIFKVNVVTGEETKIKDGGMFPIWIN